MPEEVLFESEQDMDRGEVASYLRTIADRLEDGDPVSLESGGDSLSVTVPRPPSSASRSNARGPPTARRRSGSNSRWSGTRTPAGRATSVAADSV